MKKILKLLKINNSQKAGVVVLFVLCLVLQCIYYWYSTTVSLVDYNPEKESWIKNQKKLDSLKNIESEFKMFPFNPNYISDYKGYQLGMSIEEIDRLHLFRNENKYVNSALEFQNVTKVSDSLLDVISPYFKFPDWVVNKPRSSDVKNIFKNKNSISIVEPDLNLTTQDDLIKVRGIGIVLSERILKYRDLLGGFVDFSQLNYVYGLNEEVITEVKKYFKLKDFSKLKKIKINELGIKELGQFPYFKYPISKQIVVYRSSNGNFTKIEDLVNVNGFSVDDLKIIALYLEF